MPPEVCPTCPALTLTHTTALHTSRPLRQSHFDTHLFVQRLERNGMTRPQAEGIMTVLAEVVDESVKGMESSLVSKAEQEKQRYTQKVDFAQLKSELQLHEKNDLALMKAENDRLMADVEKLKQRLREEVTRTQAGVRLDLNLEKGECSAQWREPFVYSRWDLPHQRGSLIWQRCLRSPSMMNQTDSGADSQVEYATNPPSKKSRSKRWTPG